MNIKNQPFCLYANCTVEYDGRAYSTLEAGNYLIIYKEDQSLMIHGNTKVTPLNYQSSKTKLEIETNKLKFTRKKEIIIITINQILQLTYLENWSSNQIKISRTEQELTNKIITNANNYFKNITKIETEHQTSHGPIDILIINETHNIIEVKRNKITLNNCYQLQKYLNYFKTTNIQHKGYLAGPKIAKNATKYINENNIGYIQVTFNN